MKFLEKLSSAWQHAESQLMVGLDPDPRR
ncbi:MAG TPA: orotidine 5'-phosphate decarboxylase, partial [Pusillimonas sp.]|nr:orotidine 5'-phosphate decarboxylase [Pusillimonas sp.]